MKVDVVMWSKNAGANFPLVLKRINQVIPASVVHKRILVDDGSVDGTVETAIEFGWQVHDNVKGGISNGANQALGLVDCSFFVSVEQDVLLAWDWWIRVSKLVLGDKVGAASGVRFLPKDNFCCGVEAYTLTRKGKEDIRNFGKTLDNTIWNTALLRGLGGFPCLARAGSDTYLHCLFDAKGLKWLVDYEAQSVHLHWGLLSEFRHNFFYGLSLPELYRRIAVFSEYEGGVSCWVFFKKFLVSPVAGLKMAKRMRDGRLVVAFPLVRLAWFLGYLRGMG